MVKVRIENMKTNLKVQPPEGAGKAQAFGAKFLSCLGAFFAGTDTILADQVVMGLFPNPDKDAKHHN